MAPDVDQEMADLVHRTTIAFLLQEGKADCLWSLSEPTRIIRTAFPKVDS